MQKYSKKQNLMPYKKKTMYYDQVGFISGKGERKREQEREI